MISQRILKRSFFLGIIWFIGSLQNIITANNDRSLLLFAICGITGFFQCILSCNYKNYFQILKIILIIQYIYYLCCLCYAIITTNIMACVVAAFILVVLVSTLYTLKKCIFDIN